MSSAGREADDPLDRLAAEEDWSRRADAVEHQVARQMRKQRRWRPRVRAVRPTRTGGGVSGIFLALLAITAVSGWTLWAGVGPASLSTFVFILAGWLVTLCLHEFSHALTAHRGGDHTVAGKGYLRLDPRKYGHPVLTVLLPLFFLIIGGIPLPGGAVLIETHRLRNRFRDALVSAAGPAVNIVAAAFLLVILSSAGPVVLFDLDDPHAAFWAALTFMAFLQVATAVLNLLPVPGLDGYGIIEPYLSDSARRIGYKIKPFGVLILLGLLFLTPMRGVFSDVVGGVLDVSGAPINGTYFGYQLFQFWQSW